MAFYCSHDRSNVGRCSVTKSNQENLVFQLKIDVKKSLQGICMCSSPLTC